MVAPPTVLIGSSFSSLWTSLAGITSLAGMAVIACSLLYILRQWVRDNGYNLEKSLWTSWGGPPTTRYLRHFDLHFSDAIKKDYHDCIHQLNSSWTAPTSEEECNSPAYADEKYNIAIKWLIGAATAAPRHNLVEDANALYGFRRNCLGIRRYGFWIAWASICCNTLLIMSTWEHNQNKAVLFVSLGISTIVAIFWMSVSREYVHSAAKIYAERLIECLPALRSRQGKS